MDTTNLHGKPCIRCGSTRRSKTGKCMDCSKARANAWWRVNRKHKYAMSSAWSKAWRKKHPELAVAKRAESYKRNKAGGSIRSSRRRARKIGAPGKHTTKQWTDLLASYHGLCVYCGAKATTRDHVTPLTAGGTDYIDNIAPACKPCNSSKGTKPLLTWILTCHHSPPR